MFPFSSHTFHNRLTPHSLLLFVGMLLIGGCSGSKPENNQTSALPTSSSIPDSAAKLPASSVHPSSPMSEPNEPNEPTTAEHALPELPVITFGNIPAAVAKPGGAVATSGGSEGNKTESVISRLKELQVLLGNWRGITQKEYGGFKAIDEPVWVWDFKTDKKQPALRLESEKSPYFRQLRLTYLTDEQKFQLQLTNPEGAVSVLEGTFIEPIEVFEGDDGKTQKSYKLELTETASTADEALRFVINQQNNNRYLLEIYRKRGDNDRFFRIDSVSTQREGTSLAMIDEGYGEKTCIISGGLGTITVSHKGQTFYVCCTGCKAAFEDDPERWIARYEAQKTETK